MRNEYLNIEDGEETHRFLLSPVDVLQTEGSLGAVHDNDN